MSLPQDAAKMARDEGIQTPKLAPNAFTTDKIFQIGQGEFIGRDNLQSGTGNVNATQSYPDISLTSALSAPFNATTVWRSLSAYLNQVAATNTSATTNAYVQFLPISIGGGSGTEMIIAPNGKIYPAPQETAQQYITCFDPTTDTATSVINVTTGPYARGCLAPNGKIYYAGSQSVRIAVFDPSLNTISSLSLVTGASNSLGAMVLAPNGKIYCAPNTSTMFYAIDPSTSTISSVVFGPSTPQLGTNGYYNIGVGTLAPNGKIYYNSQGTGVSIFTILDPDTNTTSTFVFPGNPQYNGSCILHPNGNVYYLGGTGTSVGVVNPYANTVRTFAGIGATKTYWVLGANNKFYSTPDATSTWIYIIDPSTESAQSVGVVLPASTSFTGMRLAPNGAIYCCRNDTVTSWLKINLLNNNNWNINTCTSPFLNKS